MTVLVDTSAWIEFLRDTGSPACEEVDRLLGGGAAVSEPIAMEVLAGARDDAHLRSLRGLLGRCETIPCRPEDHEGAAALYRSCRREGETVRKLVDCLIAAVALRADVPLLHADRDFDTLARRCGLRIHRAS